MAMKQRETELILQAARLYYEDELSQDQVAAKLNTSRSNVSRMLTSARRLGYVEIRVIAPTSRHDYVAQDRKSTRLNSSHVKRSRMPSSA